MKIWKIAFEYRWYTYDAVIVYEQLCSTYKYVDTYVIPKGTTILEGTIAPNFGQPGGGYQYYVPDPSVVGSK